MTVAEEWTARAEARTLLRQIERRFGSEARKAYQDRVANASLENLDLWLDCVVTADSVEEVFGDE